MKNFPLNKKSYISVQDFYLAKMVIEFIHGQEAYENISIKDISEIKTNYTEYLSLINKFTNSIEVDFFHELLIPLTTTTPILYLDFSKEIPSVFELNYYWNDPHHWFKVPVIDNVLSCLTEDQILDRDLVKYKELEHVEWFKDMDNKIQLLNKNDLL